MVYIYLQIYHQNSTIHVNIPYMDGMGNIITPLRNEAFNKALLRETKASFLPDDLFRPSLIN